jgi:hypothetical protein
MSALNTLRVTARFAVPLGVASATVAMVAAPAFAASSVSVSGDDAGQVSHRTTLSIVGHYDNSGSLNSKPVTLVATDASGQDHTLWSGTAARASTGNTPAISFDTDCEPWTSPCAEAPNGAYAFRVDVGSSKSSATTIRFNVPPSAVGNFGGNADGTVASFSWRNNSEPDLVDYDISTGGSDVTRGGLDPSSVCDSSGCSVSIQFGSDVSGTQQQFAIVARRRSAGGGLVESPASTTTVSFPAPPTTGPSGKPRGGGGGTTGGGGHGGGGNSGGGGGATGGGGGTAGSSHRGRTLGKHPAADLSASLPTLTAGAAPNLPAVITEVKPLPMGSYKPLVYPNQVKREPVKSGDRGVASAVVGDIANVVDSAALWRGLAAMAVLMLIAAHLRSWVERTDVVE